VDEFTVFGIVTGILVRSRLVLDSHSDYIGLGLSLTLFITTVAAFPLMRAVSFLREWNRRRKLQSAGLVSFTFRESREFCFRLLQRFRRRASTQAKSSGYLNDGALDFLPTYQLKAWQSMQVYVTAFVIACWQLGAVAVYTIHFYCYLLEALYSTLSHLGLVESTSAQWFQTQSSSLTNCWILALAYVVMFASFLVQAVSKYRNILAGAGARIEGHDQVDIANGSEDSSSIEAQPDDSRAEELSPRQDYLFCTLEESLVAPEIQQERKHDWIMDCGMIVD